MGRRRRGEKGGGSAGYSGLEFSSRWERRCCSPAATRTGGWTRHRCLFASERWREENTTGEKKEDEEESPESAGWGANSECYQAYARRGREK